MTPPVLALDVDGVLCDLNTPWLAAYNAAYGDTLTREQITRWDLHELVKPECGKDIYSFLPGGALYDTALPIPGARHAVARLRAAGVRVVFVSSVGVSEADAKRAWLERFRFLPANGTKPQPDLVFAADKSLIRCDGIVDDYEGNLIGHRNRFLFDQPWNRSSRDCYRRLHGWSPVYVYRLLGTLPGVA